MYDLNINNDYFLDFSNLRDFNRYSKKWLGTDFKHIINSNDSEQMKNFRINMILHSRNTSSHKFNLVYKEAI